MLLLLSQNNTVPNPPPTTGVSAFRTRQLRRKHIPSGKSAW